MLSTRTARALKSYYATKDVDEAIKKIESIEVLKRVRGLGVKGIREIVAYRTAKNLYSPGYKEETAAGKILDRIGAYTNRAEALVEEILRDANIPSRIYLSYMRNELLEKRKEIFGF